MEQGWKPWATTCMAWASSMESTRTEARAFDWNCQCPSPTLEWRWGLLLWPGLKTCASRPASFGFEAQDGRPGVNISFGIWEQTLNLGNLGNLGAYCKQIRQVGYRVCMNVEFVVHVGQSTHFLCLAKWTPTLKLGYLSFYPQRSVFQYTNFSQKKMKIQSELRASTGS